MIPSEPAVCLRTSRTRSSTMKSRCRRRPASLFLTSLLTLRTTAFPLLAPAGRARTIMTSTTQLNYVQDMDLTFATFELDNHSSATEDIRRPLHEALDSSTAVVYDRVEAFRSAMIQSRRTEEETYTVMLALHAAAGSNEKCLSEAADLLTILVQDCEVGVDALVAAAFHYCTNNDDVHDFELPEGSLARQVTQNAAHLKKTERIASSMIGGGTSSHEHLRNLLLAETTNWRALVIRCAARLYQLKQLLGSQHTDSTFTSSAEQNRLLAKEAMDIYAPLASRLGMHRLKNQIEDAAFQILYKKQYAKVMSLYHRWEMEPIMQRIQTKVEMILNEDASLQEYASSIKVTSRVKEPLSLWKKMKRSKAQHVHKVPDAIALRVIVDAKPQLEGENIELTRARERALCYYVQNVLIQEYLPPALAHPIKKDYIAHPKKNGYQSLHHTADAEPYLVEVQVRSGEMHRVAEYGIAAHWDYKLFEKRSSLSNVTRTNHSLHRKISTRGPSQKRTDDPYLKSVQQWQQAQENKHKRSSHVNYLFHDQQVGEVDLFASEKRVEAHLKPYLEALTTTKSDLAREQVLVFLSPTATETRSFVPRSGQILSLPYGSCVLDAIRVVEKQDGRHSGGRHSRSCFHNGSQITSLTQRLRNGDVLSMMLQEH